VHTRLESQLRMMGFELQSTDLPMLLVVLIWGANFSIVKLALAEFSPLVFTALRFVVAALILLVFLWIREGSIAPAAGSWWPLIGAGIVGNTLYQVLFTLGLSMTTAANSALLVSITPALVAFLGAMIGIERLTRIVGLGIALALLGVIFVLATRGVALSFETLGGDLLVLGSACCWTLYTLSVQSIGAKMSPLRITTLTMVTGVPGLLLVGGPGLLQMNWATISLGAWGGLAYATLLALVACYVIWNSSVQVAGSNRTAVYGCLIPIVATLVAWPLLDEQPTLWQALGAALVIAGVLLTRKTSRQARSQE